MSFKVNWVQMYSTMTKMTIEAQNKKDKKNKSEFKPLAIPCSRVPKYEGGCIAYLAVSGP